MSAVMNIVMKRGSQIDPGIEPVDELAKLWASVTRDGVPLSSNAIARAIAEAEGAALPGGEEWIADSVLAFDRCLAQSPVRVRLLIDVWYRRDGTSDTRAAKLGISRAALYTEWKATLWFLRGVLIGSGTKI